MGKTKKKLSAYNRHVQAEMKKGKTMKQAAASWKSKGKPRTSSNSKPKSKSKSNKGGSRTVSKGGFNTQKAFKYLRLGALALPAAQIAITPGDPVNKIKDGIKAYTGYDMYSNKMDWAALLKGWGPFIGASIATVGIPKAMAMLRKL